MLVQQIAPRIRSLLGNSAAQVGSDDIGELTQDGIAIAATLLTSAQARGKKVSAGTISYYAAKLVAPLGGIFVLRLRDNVLLTL